MVKIKHKNTENLRITIIRHRRQLYFRLKYRYSSNDINWKHRFMELYSIRYR